MKDKCIFLLVKYVIKNITIILNLAINVNILKSIIISIILKRMVIIVEIMGNKTTSLGVQLNLARYD